MIHLRMGGEWVQHEWRTGGFKDRFQRVLTRAPVFWVKYYRGVSWHLSECDEAFRSYLTTPNGAGFSLRLVSHRLGATVLLQRSLLGFDVIRMDYLLAVAGYM